MLLSNTFGVTDLAFQWLRSYITDRYMTFIVNDIIWKATRLDFRVPQGSVLGPFLFVSLSSTLTHFHKLFPTLAVLSSSTQLLLPIINNLVSKQTDCRVYRVRVGMESNKLTMNEEKTKAIVPGHWARTSISGTGHLEIGRSVVSFQPSVKDLGVVFDAGLTTCDHISSFSR